MAGAPVLTDPAEAEAVADRLGEIRRRIGRACERAGRQPEEVTLLGASKMQPPAKVLAAFRAGLGVFGENRVQEGAAKAGELPDEIEWHLIGPLQSNKAKPAVETFSCVHSVDRPKIARVLAREAGKRGLRLPCFVEINLAEEDSKHGFPTQRAGEAAALVREHPELELLGLMAVPPFSDEPEDSRPWFRRLRELSVELSARWDGYPGKLSMGMSHDFEIAVEEGATHVRVGTALFGPRPAA